MRSRLLHALQDLKDTSLHPGIDASALTYHCRSELMLLPNEHWKALEESNGVEAYAGYIRLFGLRTTQSIDGLEWNQPDCWKFAWSEKCSKYWCFGETAWGDQYAYDIESLRDGGTAQVYMLDAIAMTPQVIASSFTEFLEKEFIRSAHEPYDTKLIEARKILGPLEIDSHLVYVPSILIGGGEDVNRIQKMNARSAMICNGDIATQVDVKPSGEAVTGVESYRDSLHRMRLRLLWG